MSEERRARNLEIIQEFRDNAGVVGGMFARVPLLLLHHTGAKSGAELVSPLAYLSDDDRWVVAAANGGRPVHPAWYFNLQANPAAVVDVGTSTYRVTARTADGSERERLLERVRSELSFFAGMEEATERQIPLVVLQL
jgi:deazaflavin-dependent oxidoreductase (nitroreductase family)